MVLTLAPFQIVFHNLAMHIKGSTSIVMHFLRNTCLEPAKITLKTEEIHFRDHRSFLFGKFI